MNDHLAYAIGKYSQAYYSLATEPYDIRKRLLVAWDHITAIPPDMVPNEICSDVKWIYDQFTENGTAEKSLRGRHTCTCIKIAKEIIRVYCKMQQINLSDRHDCFSLEQQTVFINIDLGKSY